MVPVAWLLVNSALIGFVRVITNLLAGPGISTSANGDADGLRAFEPRRKVSLPLTAVYLLLVANDMSHEFLRTCRPWYTRLGIIRQTRR